MANETKYPATGCPPGQTLNPTDMLCYWDLPSPDGGPRIYSLVSSLCLHSNILIKALVTSLQL